MTRDPAPSVADPPFEPAAAGAEGTVFTCPLCGGEFTHGERACGGCPMARGCDILVCPHCRYQFPRSSWIVDWFTRRFHRGGTP